jgi:geranylgeranyl diphosphate synthase, type II
VARVNRATPTAPSGATRPTAEPAAASELVRRKIAEYGAYTRERMYNYLPDQEPREYLYDLVAAYPERSSGMLRPSLLIASAKAFGASTEDALRTATAVELLHNAMLVHDDIEDLSDLRRGAPSLHKKAGVPLAINAGDALGLLCLQPLLDNVPALGPLLALKILEEALETMFQTVEGQAWELGWRRDNVYDLESSDYLRMITKKTCWYTAIFPCRAGALIGTAQPLAPDQFVQFGYFLGATFQIQDDILNVASNPETYGKDFAGDIVEGKRTLMLIHLFKNARPLEQNRLKDYYALSYAERCREDVAWVLRLMDHHGSIDFSRSFARKYAGAALFEFSQAFGGAGDSEDCRFIESLVVHALERKV